MVTNTMRGIIFMLTNTLALAGLDAAAKLLRVDLHAGFIVFTYKCILLVLILPWVFSEGWLRVKTKRFIFHMMRSLFGVAGAICFYHGLGLPDISMADAAVLENIQYVIVSIIGIFYYAEKISIVKIIAILLGFIGVIIVVHPDILYTTYSICHNHFNYGYIFIILAVCFWACNTIIIKILGNTEHNKTQMFYLLLFASIFALPTAFWDWQSCQILGFNLLKPTAITVLPLTIKHILLLGIMASCYFIHGIAYFNALKAELSIVIPFRYTKLLFSGLLGYMIFNERITTIISYIGYSSIIAASGLLLIQAQLSKKYKPGSQ